MLYREAPPGYFAATRWRDPNWQLDITFTQTGYGKATSMPKLVWAGSANMWSFNDKNPLHLVDAKAAAELPKNGDRIELGCFYGLTTKPSKRIAPNTGEIVKGMYGSFFAVPANKTDTWATHVLYLPDAIQTPILKRLEGDDRVANLIVGWKVATVKNTQAAAGFQFDIVPLFPPRVDDPLERVAGLAGLTMTAAEQAEAAKQEEKAPPKKK